MRIALEKREYNDLGPFPFSAAHGTVLRAAQLAPSELLAPVEAALDWLAVPCSREFRRLVAVAAPQKSSPPRADAALPAAALLPLSVWPVVLYPMRRLPLRPAQSSQSHHECCVLLTTCSQSRHNSSSFDCASFAALSASFFASARHSVSSNELNLSGESTVWEWP